MTRNNRALWLSAAATIAFTMSCGGTDVPDGGTACTTDATCGTGKGCHPVLKTCVATCTGSSDCPSAEKTCAKINNSASSFCTCSTDALCAASTAGNICGAATRQCSAKCTSSANCPNNGTCNTGTGQCSGGGTTDAGTDAGTGMTACTSTNPEPDVCGYAKVCYSNNLCDTATNDTACANIAAAISSGMYTAWNPATGTGPIIFNVTDDADVAAGCPGGTDVALTTTVYAYAGTTNFIDNAIQNSPPLFYYTSTGTKLAISGVQVGNATNAWSNYQVSNGGKNATYKFTLCAAAGTTSINAGFSFTNGNAYCINLKR